MLSVILPRWAEPTVIHLTQDNLQRELASVHGSELLVVDDWGEGIAKCRTEFICLIEPDCLVNGGYFASQCGLFKKNKFYRQLGVMASATGITGWDNRIYGYQLGRTYQDGVMPNLDRKSSTPYAQGITYIPGAIMRMSMLKRIIKEEPNLIGFHEDLVYFSTMVSLAFWRHQGRTSINPNTTYVTTESYVGEQGKFDPEAGDLATLFSKEGL